MKLSCLQENLNRALNIVGRAVAEKAILPITKYVLLTTDEDKLRLTATNLTITISCSIPVEIEQEGSICVPAKDFSNFISTFPNDVIYLEKFPKNKISIICSKSESKLAGLSSDDFPKPAKQPGVQFGLDSKELELALRRVIVAVAKDEYRAELTGVIIKTEDGLNLAASDGFRLAFERISPIDEEIEILVPGSSLTELRKLLQGQEDKVLVTIGRSQVSFAIQDTELTTLLLTEVNKNAVYDAYRRISRDFTTKVEVKALDLLRALRRTIIVGNDIKLDIMENELSISSRTEFGDSVSLVDSKLYGNPLTIILSGKYLIEVLSEVGSEKVSLCGTSSSNALRIQPIEGGDFTYILMPLKL